MCGIAGIVWNDPGVRPDDPAFARALDAIRHRGPDAGARYDADGIWLGHRRLSILDLDARATQPMRRGRYVITFNGEIYNYLDLRARLQTLGHEFVTTSDTEVLLAAFEQYGESCLDHLEGMFAFAIRDETSGRMFLARDRFGEKPLFYFHDAKRFAFASEIPALEALLPEHLLSENPAALGLYFQLSYIPAPFALYSGMSQLEPGCWARLDIDRWSLRTTRYWNLSDLTQSGPRRSYADEVEALREALKASVRLRLFSSDVPVATFLSGGIDSSIITTIAASQAGSTISAYSISFPEDPEFDESEFARNVAVRLPAVRHRVVPATESGLIAFVDSTLQRLGEPFADASLIPTALLCASVEEKVILGGDGADELYGGYGPYRALTLTANLPGMLRRCVHRMLGTADNPHAIRQRLVRGAVLLARHLRGDSRDEYFSWRTYADTATLDALGIDCRSMAALQESYRYLCTGNLRDFQRADLQLNLPNDMLKKVDYASMLHSLEVRLPYLDRGLAQHALGLPDSYKIRGFQRKRILRDAFAGVLPRAVVRRSKKGFLLPLRDWFRHGALRSQLVDLIEGQGVLDRGLLNELMREHRQGEADHSVFLWAVFVYLKWRVASASRRTSA